MHIICFFCQLSVFEKEQFQHVSRVLTTTGTDPFPQTSLDPLWIQFPMIPIAQKPIREIK